MENVNRLGASGKEEEGREESADQLLLYHIACCVYCQGP